MASAADIEKVRKNWEEIKNMQNADVELYMEAVRQNGFALQYVPKENHTPEMEQLAIEDKWGAVQYVNEKTKELLDLAKKSKMINTTAERYGIEKEKLFVEMNHRSGHHLIYYRNEGIKQLLGKADKNGTIKKWTQHVDKFRHMIETGSITKESEKNGGGIWTSGIKSAADINDTKKDKNIVDVYEKMKKGKEQTDQKITVTDEEIDAVSEALENQAEEIAMEYQLNVNRSVNEIAGILGVKENELYFEGNAITTKDGSLKFVLNEKGEINEKAQKYLKYNITKNRKESIKEIAELFGVGENELYYNKEENTVQSSRSFMEKHNKELSTGSIYVSLNEHGRVAGEVWKELQSVIKTDKTNRITFASLGLMNCDSIDKNEENIICYLGYDELKKLIPFSEDVLRKSYEGDHIISQIDKFANTDIKKWKEAVNSEAFEQLVKRTGVTEFSENMRIDILKRTAKMLLDEKAQERNKESQIKREAEKQKREATKAYKFIAFEDLTSGQKNMVNDVNPSIRKMAAEIGYGLDMLKKDHDPEVQLAVLSHNGYGREYIIKIARSEEVQKELVKQKPDDPALATMLLKTDHPSVRAEIINRSIHHLPIEVIKKQFEKETDTTVLCAFAKQGYNLDELAKNQDLNVRVTAVESMAIRGEDIGRFAKSKDADIRIAVARSGMKLAALMKDKDNRVSSIAKEKYEENIEKSKNVICGNHNIEVELEDCGPDQIVCNKEDGIPIAKLDGNGNIEYFVNGFEPDATDNRDINEQSVEDLEDRDNL